MVMKFGSNFMIVLQPADTHKFALSELEAMATENQICSLQCRKGNTAEHDPKHCCKIALFVTKEL